MVELVKGSMAPYFPWTVVLDTSFPLNRMFLELTTTHYWLPTSSPRFLKSLYYVIPVMLHVNMLLLQKSLSLTTVGPPLSKHLCTS